MLLRALLPSVVLALSSLAPAAPVVVPEPLKGWQGWALHGEEFRQCPFFALGNPQDQGQHACALPGPASIRIAEGRAEISVGYRVYVAGYVELVHAEDAAPEALAVDGQPAIIGGTASAPRTWLESGTRQLRYSLDLAAQPESLLVPQSLRLIELGVDGRAIFPLNRAGGELWLQRAETATESDALEVVVHRLWSDGIPQQLETRIEFHVAGKAREIRLGPAWPEGYELTTVTGDLPAVVEPGRMLRVQSTAGSFQLIVAARALERGERLSFEFPASDWPQQEIWSFAANHQLRVVDVSGDSPIDPAQADVPGAWMEYPAFAMASGDALTLAERSRGLGDDANRLSLQRELWLDFDGNGYTIEDRIYGRMRQGFRVDLAQPYTLLSASERGEPLLVTAGGAGARGIELRYPALNVEATARLPWTASMPAHGWSERLDGLSTTLHLPPGYRLLQAGGADRAPQAWIERWDIYAVFIAAFAVVLAWRLGGLPLAGAVAVLVVLGVHEDDVPRYSLIALLLLLLGWQALGAGRLRRTLAVLSVLAALAFAWVALPFAIAQARYALHPQLAEGALSSNWGNFGDLDGGFAAGNKASQELAIQETMPPPPPPAPAAPARESNVEDMQQQTLEAVQVTGTRIKRVDVESSMPIGNIGVRYAKDAVVQAGVGRPNWRWTYIDLGYDGPVDREQKLDLWLSPPWLTALWRLLLVAALAAIVLLLVRRVRAVRPRTALVAALLVLCSIGSASAADMPTPEMLAELKARLTQAPECVPQCATLSTAQLEIDGDRLLLTIDAHASARVLLPLPLDDSALSEVRLTVDGEPAGALRSGGDSSGWVAVERGVHRVSLEARVRGDRLTLDFTMAPARIDVSAPNWTAAGLRDGRLLAERLELVREATSSGADDSAIARVPVKPFVRVVRRISLDLDWTVYTTVYRVAPTDGGFSVRVPLLAGEQPRDPTLRVDDGQAEVTLQPGSASSRFDSRLLRSETLTLTAPPLVDRAELWRVIVGPSLSLKTAGVPVSEPEGGIDEDDAWVHEFHPLPGETLTLTIVRPVAVPGATLVADSVDLSSSLGARSRTHALTVNLRATQGGSHALTLPADGELLSLAIDGRALNLKPEAGVLTLPIKPGTQQLSLSWREDIEIGVLTRTPSLDLGLDAANVTLRLALPADRWILRLAGPAVGPAVLYWSGLIVLLLIGYGLGRSGRALLPLRSWMLLVLGFSTLSYVPLLIVAVAFIALDARRRYLPGSLGKWRFDFTQLLLVGLTLAAFAALVVAIPAGLLGSPDMHIAGSAGSYGELAWLADRSSGELPTASAVTLPMWAYKALMLAFALWLASAVIGWIRLAWAALTTGSGWMRLRRAAATASAAQKA
jgi:hypothetical protein